MSIWCSGRDVGYDHLVPKSTPTPRGGQVRSYAEGWSNHYPTTDGTVEQPASIGLAHIPSWCVPGHGEDDDEDWVACGPWVRVDMTTRKHDGDHIAASVVMDEAAARALAAELLAWADRPKVHPTEKRPIEATR